jgi:hypothetical protein
MLSFDTALSSSIKNPNPVSFWVLKLYYNDDTSATNFIGVSDQTRIESGGDTYHALVSSWGKLGQSLDFFGFTTSTARMSVKLINVENSIQGGRFSDLLATKNFANRKWELFQNTSGLSTFDTAARMIGTGVIAGGIKYDTSFISLTLLDNNSKMHKRVPKTVVDSTTYPNAPEKNLNKPIPMAYGNLHAKTDIGTIPDTYFDEFKQFTMGAHPAIVTDKFDVGVAGVEAHPDIQTQFYLDSENVYYFKDGNYATITGTVDAGTNNPKMEFEGARCKAYFPLSASGFTTSDGTGGDTHTNEGNISNGVFDASNKCTITATAGNTSYVNFAIPQIPKLGEYVGIQALLKLGNMSGFLGISFFKIGGVVLPAYTADTEQVINLSYTTDQKASWDFEGSLQALLSSAGGYGTQSVEIVEMGIVVEFDIDKIDSKKVMENVEVVSAPAAAAIAGTGFGTEAAETIVENKMISRSRIVAFPSEIDYVYISGKGREYAAWIDTIDSASRTSKNGDSPDPGYESGELCENPVYIIENILRIENSLDSSTDGSDINIESFDMAGAKQTGTSGVSKKGDIAYALDDAIEDIKFAFSQPKFIGSKDLIDRLCRQITSYVWLSGDGNFKIRTLLRMTDTPTSNKTINYYDINLKSISRTPVDNVRNSIVVNYAFDYAEEQFKEQTTASDGDSQGTAVGGNNQVLKLELGADTSDPTTAGQIADAQLKAFKDRRIILQFDCLTPAYNMLEITDVIIFENWDSSIKLYGVAMGTDYFMITNISKTPFGCSITAIQVKTLANA